ncbi:hypothetical protein I302_100589 [Kwoniella bestiolae CBS 10118]|uniref:DUF5745 domain-containing protein n=1 Tax=Kwoniella bestiolae CBS 10118 TaxID=1296100 RepID=A0A1B9G5K5_9TREE|nr:hypothetical protein I302_03964 [Kwoniella bestiolae CBS 10118]OCF26282.1 hypothetical protein I302_03964 [Kwoniella bestiolae CBS 10118]
MLSDTLALLRSLLATLNIPINPPSLSSIPPSLILLTLESILKQRLSIPEEVRRCNTEQDAIGLVKCLLGILADDLLGIDMSLIDPIRVLRGKEREMEVVIMGVVVVAKRNGIDLDLGRMREEGHMHERRRKQGYGKERMGGRFTLDDEDDTEGSLPRPIQPDRSFSFLSPINESQDVFGVYHEGASQKDVKGTERQGSDFPEILDDGDIHVGNGHEGYANINDISRISDEFDPFLTPIHDTFPRQDTTDAKQDKRRPSHGNEPLKQSYTSTSTTSGFSSISGKTVLQCMIEEFGLEPG